jgi:hypothetical protein
MKQAYFLFACLCVLGFAEIYAQSPVLLKEINPSGGSYGYEGSVVLGNKLFSPRLVFLRPRRAWYFAPCQVFQS